MRMLTILAVGAALSFATAASAQQAGQPPAAAPNAPSAQSPSEAPTVRTVTIVDITELPQETQTQVNEMVAQQDEANLQQLRSSIDANNELKSALSARGLTSAHVIVANLTSDGNLILVTKKPS
ncbi:hypothetical protein [Rhodoligotrophos ferricapiens]|uniref:hypothetical protein n=1 Tax=Rhodoligotrophos ferricapiens TaxID=3069264 RepID=UPI00315CA040